MKKQKFNKALAEVFDDEYYTVEFVLNGSRAYKGLYSNKEVSKMKEKFGKIFEVKK